MRTMSKKDPFRFTVKLDSADADHREVAAYLNRIGRRKARVIVKAIQAYLQENAEEQRETYMCPEGRIQEKERTPAEKETSGEISVSASPKETIAKIRTEEETHHLDIAADLDGYQIDQAEVELMRRNFEKLRKEG